MGTRIQGEMADLARREAAERLRAESAACDVSSPATWAAVLSALGRVGGQWSVEACRVIGIDVGIAWLQSDAMAGALKGLPRKELEAVVRLVAMLAEADDFGAVYSVGEHVNRRAVTLRAEASTAALRDLLATVPPPALDAEAALAQHLSAVETALRRATAGCANERMGREVAGDFPARVDALRAALAAADAWLSASDLPATRGPLDELSCHAHDFLDLTPDVILLLPRPDQEDRIAREIAAHVRDVQGARQSGDEETVRATAAELRGMRDIAARILGDAHGTAATAIADADSLLADLEGRSATVFGAFAAQEEASPAPPAAGPEAMLSDLVMRVRGAVVHADNKGLSAEDEAAAMDLLRRRYKEADDFFNAHEVEYALHDWTTMEEAADRLRQAVEEE